MSSTFITESSTFFKASSKAMLDAPCILIFDSGVGGLSIFGEIQQKLPHANLIYASDNAAFPYGTKSETDLIARVDTVLRKLIDHYPIDIIVIACNTASTLTLPFVRQQFTQPVVGVVPAIKPAAALSKTQVIGLLATPATVARPYTHALIQEHAPTAEVILVGSSELVQLAENKLRGATIDPSAIATILQPLLKHPRSHELDTLVLACTHFPLLRHEIAAQFTSQVVLIDSGEAIARRVASLWLALEQERSPNTGNQQTTNHTPVAPTHSAVFTEASPAIEALLPELSRFGITHFQFINA